MIGIIIVTHQTFGEALLNAAVHIVGKKDYVEAVAIYPGEGLDTLKNKIETVLNKWEQLKGVLIMVDLFGGTPFNASVKFLTDIKVEVISGINMSMLLTAFTQRENMDISALADCVVDSSKNNIIRIRTFKRKSS